MKRFLSLYIPTLFFGVYSNLSSRVFNSKLQGSSKVVDAGTTETQVRTSSNFGSMVFDEESNTMYLANNASGQVNHSVMRANIGKNSVTLAALGGAATSAGATPLSGKAVDRVMQLDSGDLLVLLKADADRTQFYVIHDPNGSSPEVVASPVMKDVRPTPADSRILSITAAGQTSDGKDRIVVAVVATSADSASPLATESNLAVYSTLWTFLYDSTAGTITGGTVSGQGIGQSRFVADGSAMTLGKTGIVNLLTGASLTNIKNISTMVWNPELKRLFVGTAGSALQNISFLAVGRFTIDDENLPAGFVSDHDLALEAFAPLSAATAANVSSMKTDYWTVNYIDFLVNPTTATPYMLLQVDYGPVATIPTGAVFALPIVGSNGTSAGAVGKFAAAEGDATAATAFACANHGFLATQTPTALANACSDVKSLVGGYELVRTTTTAVATMDNISLSTYGTTVFLVAKAPASSPARPDAGIFASSPIYAADGSIAGWSAWQKAFADSYHNVTGGVVGAAIDSMHYNWKDGRVYYTARNYDATTPVVNEVGCLAWGTGDAQGLPGVAPFLTQINADFSTGVLTAVSFPAVTTLGLGAYGLTVVAARNKVALLSTGGLLTRRIGSSDSDGRTIDPLDRPYAVSGFNGTEVDSDNLPLHYQLFTDIDGIGDVLCAEVARVSNVTLDSLSTVDPQANTGFPNTHGFIFVGGEKGIAVLRKADGSGFNASCGKKSQSSSADYISNSLADVEATFADMTFKRIPGINEPIHEMISSCGFLYAMGSKTVYRIRLHSYLSTLFPDTDYLLSATMFKDDMTVQQVTANETLDDLTGSYSVDITSTVTRGTTATTFNSDVVVVQPVLAAAANEYFCCMAGFPNKGPILVASNFAGSSNIYAIKNPAAVSCAAAPTDWDISVFGDANYKKNFSYTIRRMALAQINTLNGNLETYQAGTTPSRSYIANTSGTGLYSAGGVIGNLYVMTGAINAPASQMYVHAVSGNVKGLVQNGSEKQLLFPLVTLMGDATWLSPAVGSMSTSLGLLPSGADLTGPAYVYAHSSNGVNNHLNLLDFEFTPILSRVEAETKTDSYVFSSLRFENGSQVLFGWPFGARAID